MTPEEALTLSIFGREIVEEFAATCVFAVLYGLYLGIYVAGTHALLRRRAQTQRRHSWIFLVITLLICILISTSFVLVVALIAIRLRGVLVSNADVSLDDRMALVEQQIVRFSAVFFWLSSSTGIQVVFGDAIVVWRACVVWPHNKAIKFALLALLLLDIASTFATCLLYSLTQDKTPTMPIATAFSIMDIFAMSYSLFVNVIATTLIGIRAYRHRNKMKATLGIGRSPASTVLLFMTESGFVFCAIQMIALSLNIPDNESFTPLDYACRIWGYILPVSSAIYPILVILIVEHKCSIADQTGLDLCDDLSSSNGDDAIDGNRREGGIYFTPATKSPIPSMVSAMTDGSVPADHSPLYLEKQS